MRGWDLSAEVVGAGSVVPGALLVLTENDDLVEVDVETWRAAR
jgi:hypothetical protein